MNAYKDIDESARVNLDYIDLMQYERYKESLIAEGETKENIEMILNGFIWDCIECY